MYSNKNLNILVLLLCPESYKYEIFKENVKEIQLSTSLVGIIICVYF